MGVKHLTDDSSRVTPQSEQIPGRTEQVVNSAGGYVWNIDKWARLRRFLIIGTEGGSYYAGEHKLTGDALANVRECIAEDPRRTVDEIVTVSDQGLAPRNDQAIAALALCASVPKDPADRNYALDNLERVCRIGTHLLHFVQFVEQHRGWGRGLKRAVARWLERDADKVAYQAVKYRQRDGWSMRDLLRVAHPSATSPAHTALYNWICGRDNADNVPMPEIVDAFDRVQKLDASKSIERREMADLIIAHRLPREALPTEALTQPVIWEALLHDMPMTAMIRNLANMTRLGLLTSTSDATLKVITALGDKDALTKSRIHPISVLIALMTYRAGRGLRSSNTWTPVTRIVDSLDGAFYASFGNVVPSNKRILIALDVSGSMSGHSIMDVPDLTPRLVSAAMAMITVATEPLVETIAFTGGGSGWYGGPAGRSGHYGYRGGHGSGSVLDDVSPLTLSWRRRLDDIVNEIEQLPFGGTDCALPMIWAKANKKEFDTFVVYTDNETWAGNIHPSQALKQYREATGIPARLAVFGMVVNDFTIADPSDSGMMDFVGFDSSAPQILSEFSAGKL